MSLPIAMTLARRSTLALLAVAAVLLVAFISSSQPHFPAAPAASDISTFQPSPVSPSSTLRFDRLSLEEGLSQSAVLTIRQDRQGFMWFGTEGGLNRYDGYQFTVYKHDAEDPNSLVDDYVSSIFEDHGGTLWIGTRSGLDRLNPSAGTFMHYEHDPNNSGSLSGKWVVAIGEDNSGALWVGTDDGGLNRLDRATNAFTHYRHDPSDPRTMSNDGVSAIYADRSGDLWIGTRGGLNLLDPSTGVFTHYLNDPNVPSSLSGNEVSALFEDQSGALWIGTQGAGLDQWDPATQSFTRYQNNPTDPHSLSHDRVRAILQDSAGRLWIGTQNGLDAFDAQRRQFIHFRNDPSDPHSLSDNAIWSIYEDHAGVIWFGTYSGGVNKYSDLNNRFALYRHNPYVNSLSDNMVWSIAQDRSGIVWIGTFNGGLNKLDREPGAFTTFRHLADDPSSLSSDDVRAILEDRAGNLWVGTSGGLDRMDRAAGRFIHYRNDPKDPTSLSDNRVIVLYEDRAGNLWVGTRNGGLDRLDSTTGTFTRYQHAADDPSSLSDDRVWSLYQDHLGALWVGTLGAINVLDPAVGRFTQYAYDPANPRSPANAAAFSFHENSDGTMWIGTWGGGLDRFDRSTLTFTHFTDKNGLPDNTIYAIEPDAQGLLWLSTNHGIARFDPRTTQSRNFDVRDGLQGNEFNAGAHWQNARGEIFFGGTQGFNSFYPQQIRDNPNIPQVVITNFSKSNRSERSNLPSGEHLTLNYDDNFISFDFSALDYVAPAKNQFAYMMQGLDKDWVYAGTRRHADYPNLRPGEYIFRVKASNNDGIWNEQGASIYVDVTPPFWETWWVRGVVVLALIGAAVGVFQWRLSDLRARSLLLENQVVARTAEIARHTQELEALFRADQELYSHLSLDQVLQALVDVAVDVLHVDKSTAVLWDEASSRYVVRIVRGFTGTSLSGITLSKGEGLMGQVLATGEPVVVEDASADPRAEQELSNLREAAQAEGIHSFMHIPLRVKGDVLGLISVAFTQPHAFSMDEQRMYLSLAQRAAVAIENAQLYERSQHAAALEERNRLARELHDAVTQTLFSASLIAEVLPRLWSRSPEEGQRRLEELRQLTRGALAEMRTLLLELRPTALADASLNDLLRQLAEAFTGRTRVPVDLSVQGQGHLPAEVQIALYRIAQEALNNIAKHAGAAQVWVHLEHDAERVELRIRDNGCGFDPSRIAAGHLGLGIIRERSRDIGAQLTIESAAGAGSSLQVIWPRE